MHLYKVNILCYYGTMYIIILVCLGAKTRRELKRFLPGGGHHYTPQSTMMVIYPIGKFSNEISDGGIKKKQKKLPTLHNNRTKYVLAVFFFFVPLTSSPAPPILRVLRRGGIPKFRVPLHPETFNYIYAKLRAHLSRQ